jgi:hypothetical protein
VTPKSDLQNVHETEVELYGLGLLPDSGEADIASPESSLAGFEILRWEVADIITRALILVISRNTMSKLVHSRQNSKISLFSAKNFLILAKVSIRTAE